MSGSVSLSNGLPLAVIGERVRAERTGLGLSLEDVAERSGVSRSMVSEIERGRKVPTIVVLDRITAAWGYPLNRTSPGQAALHGRWAGGRSRVGG